MEGGRVGRSHMSTQGRSWLCQIIVFIVVAELDAWRFGEERVPMVAQGFSIEPVIWGEEESVQ